MASWAQIPPKSLQHPQGAGRSCRAWRCCPGQRRLAENRSWRAKAKVRNNTDALKTLNLHLSLLLLVKLADFKEPLLLPQPVQFRKQLAQFNNQEEICALGTTEWIMKIRSPDEVIKAKQSLTSGIFIEKKRTEPTLTGARGMTAPSHFTTIFQAHQSVLFKRVPCKARRGKHSL